MASKLTYKRTTTDKITVKGVLSTDGTYITYEDEKKDTQEVKIADLLKGFVDCPIDFSVSLKAEEELDLESEDE